MNDRNRGTPETLARDQPIAEAIILRSFTEFAVSKYVDDLRDRIAL